MCRFVFAWSYHDKLPILKDVSYDNSPNPTCWFFQVLPLQRVGPEIQLQTRSLLEVSPPKSRNERDGQHYMDVSENRGTPKSSIFIRFSIINHPFFGVPGYPYFWKHPYPNSALLYLSTFHNRFHPTTHNLLWHWATFFFSKLLGIYDVMGRLDFLHDEGERKPWTPWCWTNGTFFIQHPNWAETVN